MRRHLIFLAAGLGLLMYSIDSTVIAVALPNFIKDFGTNVLWAAWTISIYLIAITTIMPLAGTLSDNFGRKKIFLISLVVFTGSSVACGLAPNIYTLVGFRFLQGIGGASILPAATGIVSENFPEHRERAIGLFTSIFPIGGILGPNLGGWLVSQYSWRYIFYINLPIGIVLIVLIMILLKDSKTSSRRPIDLLGTTFFSGMIISMMLGFNIIGESLSRASLVLAAGFFLLSFAFVFLLFRREAKASDPVLDLVLLKSKPFLAANLYNLMIGAGVFALFSFVPLYATSVHRLSTLASGMILTPRSLGVIPASTVVSFLLRRWGYRWPMIVGMIIISISTVLFSQGLPFWRFLGVQLGIAEILALLAMVTGIGMGITFPAANNACIELMPEKIGTITGLRGMFRTIGGALGVSIITVILHVCSDPTKGFTITFISFGLGLLFSIPLVFLMPAGKRQPRQDRTL